MNDLTKWLHALNNFVRNTDPNAFVGVDLLEVERQIEDLATLVSHPLREPFSVRDNHGGSGQSDSS